MNDEASIDVKESALERVRFGRSRLPATAGGALFGTFAGVLGVPSRHGQPVGVPARVTLPQNAAAAVARRVARVTAARATTNAPGVLGARGVGTTARTVPVVPASPAVIGGKAEPPASAENTSLC